MILKCSSARGAHIVLEGADRCGKSTQSRMLVEELRRAGVDAELWSFPDRSTAIGSVIDAYLAGAVEIADEAVHLLFAANRWEKRDAMIRTLNAGTTLIVDRSSLSGVAYTAAKGVDRAWCKASDAGLPAPDAVFFLELSAAAGAARGGYGDERYETPEFQEAVMREFEALREPGWLVVDAARSVGEVHAELCAAAMAVVSL